MAQKYCVFILHLLKNPTAPSHTIPNSLFAACCRVKNLFFLCQPVFVDFFVVSVELVLLVVKLLVVVLLVVNLWCCWVWCWVHGVVPAV